MKCQACKFDDTKQTVKEYQSPLFFIEVEGHFTAVFGGAYYQERTQLTVYACPKCGTLRINNWRIREVEDE